MGAHNELADIIRDSFDLKEVDIRTYSPLSLAFIGDVVYDLIFRSYIVLEGSRQNNKLHNATAKLVMAPTQAQLANAIMDELSKEELAIFKRGRNSNPHSIAKSGSREDYMKATGLEALIGYLYLAKNIDRAIELLRLGLERIDLKE